MAAILTLLGYADPSEKTLRNFVATVRKGALNEELRRTRLVPAVAYSIAKDRRFIELVSKVAASEKSHAAL